ncbi:acid protease [Trametes gibbosa]|nr:acid protease [Trametes gibbosa]
MPAAGLWALVLATLPTLVSSVPLVHWAPSRRDGFSLPFIKRSPLSTLSSDQDLSKVTSGSVGLGDRDDVFYTVSVTVGDTTTALNIDTGSSDLWIITPDCHTKECDVSNAPRYDELCSDDSQPSGVAVDMRYGDSTTGSYARGKIGRNTVTLAGLTVPDQAFAAVDDTDNYAITNGAAGVLGLGFPAQSFIQVAAVQAQDRAAFDVDALVSQTDEVGPLIPRLALSGAIAEPLFAITLQRDTIDVSGKGQLTVGKLPDGVDESSITWVPVRRYAPADGGLPPPSFAPDEVYPMRWEVEIDAVYLDGEELPQSTQSADGIPNPSLSALIDTGNSLIRGPPDVVNSLHSKVSPAFAADPTAPPRLPCSAAHTLAFKIGGKTFPVDPRDFVAPAAPGGGGGGGASACVADTVVGTDAPRAGALYSWNLGDPFLKSTLVAFYYGNLTHPSVDPPRVGFASLVPPDAAERLRDAVARAGDGDPRELRPYSQGTQSPEYTGPS